MEVAIFDGQITEISHCVSYLSSLVRAFVAVARAPSQLASSLLRELKCGSRAAAAAERQQWQTPAARAGPVTVPALQEATFSLTVRDKV